MKTLLMLLVMSQAAHALAASSPGHTAKSAADRYNAWRNEAVRLLSTRPDAGSLATAAALDFTAAGVGGNSASPSTVPSALQLIGRAGDLAPENAAIAWLHLQLCANTPSCESRDAAIVLRWVDPENGAAWLGQLSTAHKDRDNTEVDRLLGDMARGTRFDLYYNQIVVMMFDALNVVRRELPGGVMASDTERMVALAGIANAEIIPAFSPLIDSCRASAAGSERRADCLKLAKIMQRGDTVIVQMVGFGIEKRLIPADGREARSLAERRRLLEWRLSAASKLDESILPWTQGARTRTRLAQMRLRPREEDVCIALLREHKLPLEPENHHD